VRQVVIYNSFLSEIAAPEDRDAVSSKGWGIGYLGGGVLLALNLVLLMKAEAIGITTGWPCGSASRRRASGGRCSRFRHC
jgi:MFS-type transporter involved in bile tolerance (Atg22 family)